MRDRIAVDCGPACEVGIRVPAGRSIHVDAGLSGPVALGRWLCAVQAEGVLAEVAAVAVDETGPRSVAEPVDHGGDGLAHVVAVGASGEGEAPGYGEWPVRRVVDVQAQLQGADLH